MTLKDMIKKVNAYNELAEVMKTSKVVLGFSVDLDNEHFDDYKSLTEHLKENYVDEAVDAILGYKGYEFDSDRVIEFYLPHMYNEALKSYEQITVGTYLYTK